MTKIQVFLLGVILTLTAVWPIVATAYYVPLVISLGRYSLFVFPLTAGILSVVIVRLFRSATMTLDIIIERINLEPLKNRLSELLKKGKFVRLLARVPLCLVGKMKTERLKNILAKLFKKGRLIALIGSAFLFCPFVIPIVAKTCIKNEKSLYLATAALNVAMTFILNCFYVAGWEVIKAIFKFKLSCYA